MLDWAGYIRKSKIFPGNISEPKTLEVMTEALNPPAGTMMIMDRGIATAANIEWMVSHGFRYLVVNRKRPGTSMRSLGNRW
jgi:transposase